MLGRGAGGPSNSTSYGNESFVRCRVINTLPRDSSLMDIAELTKNRERVVINECCSQNDAFFNFGSGRLKRAIGEKRLSLSTLRKPPLGVVAKCDQYTRMSRFMGSRGTKLL